MVWGKPSKAAGLAGLCTMGSAIGPRCCVCRGNALLGRLNEEANRAGVVG
jgi:hypothetical protein